MLENFDDEEEEKLDLEYKQEIEERLNEKHKEDILNKNSNIIFTDIMSYLEKVGLYGTIGTHLSIQKIKDFINYLNSS